MIKAEIKGELNFPVLALQKDLVHIAQRIFIPYMVEGIDAGRAIDGGSFPPLAPITLKRKKGPKTLIETGKLRRSFKSRLEGKKAVVIDLMADRQEIGDVLQLVGVGHKKKKFKFFGISPEMERRAMDYIKTVIDKAIKDGGKRTTIR